MGSRSKDNITHSSEWIALLAHQRRIASQHMRKWFNEDLSRFEHFSLQFDDILLDFSKNKITSETLPLLFNLAKKADLSKKIHDLFTGQILNSTENRSALHTALRVPHDLMSVYLEEDIARKIKDVHHKMAEITTQVRNQIWRGATGRPIQHIINIGIGGSHLGPRMAVQALKDFSLPTLKCHFISNIDTAHLTEVLNEVDPETSLFIISSKSFATLETVLNAQKVKQWLCAKIGEKDWQRHFLAVTAAFDKARAFGLPKENIFPIWDWVGGRYSVWSAIGLPVAFMIGMPAFQSFLAGGHAMDQHFQKMPFEKNLPVILALLGVWYINFFGVQNHAIVPYTHLLRYFRSHLQQLDMESNGKSVTHAGFEVNYATGPVLLGEHGCNGQHAFHQLFHQGSGFVPVDFILLGECAAEWREHHDVLIASGLSQAQALMRGKTHQEAYTELLSQGYSSENASKLAPHKVIQGNRPSNTLFLKKMSPYHLGLLLALYEHKIFAQGVLWDINSFDQWGVELGKQLLPSILNHLQRNDFETEQDASTHGLIHFYKKGCVSA